MKGTCTCGPRTARPSSFASLRPESSGPEGTSIVRRGAAFLPSRRLRRLLGGRFWLATRPLSHSFAYMGAVEDAPSLLDCAEGGGVWDEDGRRYLDGSGSLWYANVGHGREEIANVAPLSFAGSMRSLSLATTRTDPQWSSRSGWRLWRPGSVAASFSVPAAATRSRPPQRWPA